MIKNEDKLLKDFFDSKRQEIKDNGFSERVMRKLPTRRQRIVQIWSAVCTGIGVLIFFSLDGLELILNAFREGFMMAIENGAEHIDPKTIGIVAVVCMGLVIHKATSYSL
ncbi:MAG: DUF5056 domain-containing protein [Bacteroides sp.]|nr:DUF5056 domain-containing protein [Bacteroides sp.]